MFKKYTGNEQFDLQINRFTQNYEDSSKVQADLKEIVPQLLDTQSWYKIWSQFATKREEIGDYSIASNYYKAADFYLSTNDLNKQKMYDGFRDNFYKGYHEFDFERYEIPYESSFLPAVKLINPGAHKTLIVIGGFDGYMEEVIPMMRFLKNIDYNIIIFDGPGQGTALKNGLKFIMNFEKPVSTVIDYFNLQRVSLMGISWGGYFVMRAAAFEKRAEKIIAFDILYCALDAFTCRMPKIKADILMTLIKNGEADKLNAIINKLIADDIDLNWKVNNGYAITGETTPYGLFKNLEHHTMKGIGQFVNQDVLLLAGEDDQYVPISRLSQIQQELYNAASITTKVFTKETGGAEHCQAGRADLALTEIKKFLSL
ncbi:alpha/beta hydrolase [Clostridium estertheticum]|uniref:alpha/beta hydrolase n=1 Tax=Clostridium estertheticum TaxID=238834 RepID=UPI001CF54699|nr:alpha/beta hydrolase [Clostridium estertheticum]MCB2309382.1 alpha/beta hydrolase [Clostridium estertheticum]MCB2347829.1 alpha/beta hydrolase [Clostridium estertheticum]MCB2352352.1 alpha/beta hydrolase [Clostridium estertheticum]WAG48324.1 alpha/beta hydrolase [Clostridium estertheticum]